MAEESPQAVVEAPAPAATPPEATAPAPEVSTSEPPAATSPPKPKAKEIAAQGRAFALLREQRRAMVAQSEQWQQERQQLYAQLQQTSSGLQQLSALRAELEEAKKDPLVWAGKHGTDPNTAIKKQIQEGTPEKAIEEMRAQLKMERQERESLNRKWEEDKKSREAETARQQELHSLRSFVSHVVGSEKEYPHLNVLYDAGQIGQQAMEIHEWAKKEGHQYSLKEVGSFLEKRAKAWYEQQESRRSKLLPSPASAAPQVSAPVKKPAPASGPRENERPRKPGPRERQQAHLSEEQQRALDLASLRKAYAIDGQRPKLNGK